MDTKASFDDEDNSPPHLPDMSVGSSVSSSLENEYNELLLNTMVVPLYEPEKIHVKKVLQNSLGLFSTHILPVPEVDDQKKIAHSNDNEASSLAESNHESCCSLIVNKQEANDSISETKGKEKDFNNESSFLSLTNKEDESNVEKQHSIEEITIKETEEKMDHVNMYEVSEDSSSSSSSSANSHLEKEMISNVQSMNTLTTVSDEIYSIMQKQLEITQLDPNSFDANPRKDSPTPATPLTNIDLNINESISMEHTNNNNQQSKTITDTNPNKQLFKSNLRNGQTNDNKSCRIGNNLDKWLKELKGQVISEFEKTKAQLMYDQQKKLYEEKERQSMEVCKIKRELEITRERLKIAEINIVKKNEAIESVSKAFDKQREKTDLQRVMMEWKFKKVENEKEDFTIKIADKFYTHRLKIKSFLNWHCFMANRHKTKLEKACKKKAEEVCYDLATKYEAKIKKLDDEVHRSRGEIDCYKDEMAKNEDYMKKALMRGVCALNMEAMSIFHDNVSNKTQSQTNSTSSLENLDSQEDEKQTKNHVAYCSNNYQTSEMNSNRSTRSSDTLNSKELAKKVKNYCEKSLNSKSISNVAKAKMTLVNSAVEVEDKYLGIQTPVINQTNVIKEKEVIIQDQQLNNIPNQSNTNRLYTELTEHNIKPNIKNTPSSKYKVKSKINSYPSTPKNQKKDQFITAASPRSSTKSNAINSITRGISNLPPQAPAYRSVVIEKHTNQVDDSIKSNTTKVKYAPPGQPATVLNTVINSQNDK